MKHQKMADRKRPVTRTVEPSTKKSVCTSLLTPLQVQDAIVMWARHHRMIGTYEDVSGYSVELRKDGSAAIKKFRVQP